MLRLSRRQPASPADAASDQFRIAFDHAAVGMSMAALDGRFLRVNDALCRMLGYGRDELLALRFHDVASPADGRLNDEMVRRLLEREQPAVTYEKRCVHKRGHVVWILLTVALVPDGRGGLLYLAQMQDLSRRRAAEEALARSERCYRAVVEQASDGISVSDGDGRLLDANPALCALLGYPREELLRLDVRDLLAPDQPQPLVGFEELRAGRRFVLRRRLLRRDGTAVSAEVAVNRLDDGRLLAVVRDLSQRERAASERRESERRLARAAAVETSGLAAAAVAHDINNLLMTAVATAQLALDETPPGAPARAPLQALLEAAERCGGLVRRLLRLGHAAPAPARCDLREALAGAEELVRRAAGADVSVRVDACCGAVPVPLAAEAVERVLLNLALNARDAMPGGGALTLELRRDGDAVLTVADTGAGMTEEVRARAFEAYSTTKPPAAGSGLGLWTVAQLVAAAGGAVDLASAPGAGTTVTVRLPLADAYP